MVIKIVPTKLIRCFHHTWATVLRGTRLSMKNKQIKSTSTQTLYLENHERYAKTDNCNGFVECFLVYIHFQNFENLNQLHAIDIPWYLGNRERYGKTDNCNGFVECCLVYAHFQNFQNLNQLHAIDVSWYLGNRERYGKTDNCNGFVECCLVYAHF